MKNSHFKTQNSPMLTIGVRQNRRTKPKTNSGFALVTVLFVMIILLAVGTLFISIVSFTIRTTKNFKNSTKAFYLAESGIEKAIWELNQTQSAYTGETDTALDGGKFTTQVETDPADPNKRIITSTGFYPEDVAFPAKRQIRIYASAESSEESIAFHYAIQIGDLGLLMYSNSEVNGNTYSNGDITGYSNTQINGDAYAVGTISSPKPVISGERVEGTDPQPLPTVDIEFWKEQANVNEDPIIGDYEINSGSHTLGPRKIEGNLSINSSAILTVTGPLHVTGNFEMNSNGEMHLDESFGSQGTVVVVDGTVRIDSNAQIYPTSADPKGYILVATTDTSMAAVELNSNSAGGIFYALDGGIQINSNGHAVSVVGKKLILNSNAVLDYDIGLASSIFTSGPGGAWVEEPETWDEIY